MILQFLVLFMLAISLDSISTSSSSSSSKPSKTCMDHHKACPIWSKEYGECQANPGFMLTHCKLSCGKCDTPCFDTVDSCSRWAREGKCKDNPTVNAYCPISCDSCGKDTAASMMDDCVDQNDGCKGWAKNGECTSSNVWMLTTCPESCKSCISPVNNS